MSKRIRSIPDIPAQTPTYLRPLLQALKEGVAVRAGQTANTLDSNLTVREMIAENYIHDPDEVEYMNKTVNPIFLMTPDEVYTYVDNNVTDLAEARALLKQIVILLNNLVALQR